MGREYPESDRLQLSQQRANKGDRLVHRVGLTAVDAEVADWLREAYTRGG